jgi:heterodisulfide reductase subunit A-like polyferredoxin
MTTSRTLSWVSKISATEKARLSYLLRSEGAISLSLSPAGRWKQSAVVVGAGIAGIEQPAPGGPENTSTWWRDSPASAGWRASRPSPPYAQLELTPKMVSAGRHENITLLSYSELDQ